CRRIGDERGMFAARIVETNQPASRGGQPEATDSVGMHVHDPPWRQALVLAEARYPAAGMPNQSVVEANPDLPGAIFSERERQIGLQHPSRQVLPSPARSQSARPRFGTRRSGARNEDAQISPCESSKSRYTCSPANPSLMVY